MGNRRLASGWAIIDNDEIKVRTVSPTRRAALVNFLLVERLVAVLEDTSDEAINQLWEQHRGDASITLVMIRAKDVITEYSRE